MPSLDLVIMQRSDRKMIRALGPGSLKVAEISGKWGSTMTFRSYRPFLHPAHDICAGPVHVPYHAARPDTSRGSARGLKNVLIEAGFDEDAIETDQWGNRSAARRNLETPWPPAYRGEIDPLDNDRDMPICAWALARKT